MNKVILIYISLDLGPIGLIVVVFSAAVLLSVSVLVLVQIYYFVKTKSII